MKDKTYYLEKSIELSNESKKRITLETSIIYDYPNDNELGKEVRRRIIEKSESTDEYIKYLEGLIKERT